MSTWPSNELPPRQSARLVGRGSSAAPKNRFEKIEYVASDEHMDPADVNPHRKVPTEYFDDASQTIVSENQSPDVDFRYSLNPYRGCLHGCSYCYARPTHEYLGLNAGIDFETKIIIKRNAGALFEKWLRRKDWKKQVEPVMLSGVTDCYQPCEREFQLTRQCLKIALAFNQPMRITTKNSLVTRDVDLLSKMAEKNLIVVTVSLASLDQSLLRVLEPRSSSIAARLEAIRTLSSCGIPVKTLVAPIVLGLNDNEIPALLSAVAEAGSCRSGYVMLRLPLSVEPVFIDWLQQHRPDSKDKILGRIRSSRGGNQLYDSDFSQRMKGQGIWADQISALFKIHLSKNGLSSGTPSLDCHHFEVPGSQRMLF